MKSLSALGEEEEHATQNSLSSYKAINILRTYGNYTVGDKNILWRLDVLFIHGGEGKSYHLCAALEELVIQEPGCWWQCWLPRRCSFLHPTARLWLCRGDRSLETQIADCPLVQMMDIHWRSKQMTILVGNKKEVKVFGKAFHFFFSSKSSLFYFIVFSILYYIQYCIM